MTTAPGTPIAVAMHGPRTEHVERFYRALLGWDFRTATTGATVAVDEGGTPIATVLPGGAGIDGWVVTLRAPRNTEERITAAGGKILDVEAETIYAVDPAGAVFAIAAPPMDVPLPPPALGRPAWFENMTTDSAGADQFYTRVFELAVQGTRGDDDFVLFVSDRGPVAGRLGLPPGLDRILGVRWMTYFAHADVDHAAEQVTGLGGTILVPPRDTPTGRVTAVTDPEGAVLTLLTQHHPVSAR